MGVSYPVYMRIGKCLIDAVDMEAAGFQCVDNRFDMFVAVGFGGHFQLYILYAVQRFELIVFQLNYIGPVVAEDLGNT